MPETTAYRSANVPSMYEAWIPPAYRDRIREYFVYGNDILPIAVGGNVRNTISIDASADFLAIEINATFRTNAAPPVLIPDPALTLNIIKGSSGRELFNTPQDVVSICGSARLPGYLGAPILIERSQTLSTQWVNLQGVAVEIRYGFHGFKLF